MTRLLSLLLLLGFATPLAAQHTRTVNKTLPLNPDGILTVDTYKGSIRVTTWDRAEVQVDARIEADAGGASLVEDTEIRFDGNAHRLTLETDYDAVEERREQEKRDRFSLPFVHYTIRMPATAALRIDDYKSDIDVDGLRAGLRIETYKGTVNVRDLDGDLQLETYKGDAEVTFARLRGDSAIDTFKGSITLRLPPDAGFSLDADLGRKGDLDADFRLPEIRREDRAYRTDIHGGGPRLRLETHKGTFRLDTR